MAARRYAQEYVAKMNLKDSYRKLFGQAIPET
jgi:hypothetical protein